MGNLDKTYHGTSDSSAKKILLGKVSVSVGGGELGQGFYLGTALHVAKAWAKQKHNCETVIEFQVDIDDFFKFDVIAINLPDAINYRLAIRSAGKTRSFKFRKDIVWGSIVGGSNVYSDQLKWESKKGETHLNSSKVLRGKR